LGAGPRFGLAPAVFDPIRKNHFGSGFAAGWAHELKRQLTARGGQLIALEWQGGNTIFKFTRLVRFVWLLARYVPRSDAIFIHQHPLYAILAAPFARLFGKKIYLWYVHKQVDFKLKLATAFCDGVFTASRESFRLGTKRPVHIVGHGIDTEIFHPGVPHGVNQDKFSILSVGRISRVKGYEVLLTAALELTMKRNVTFFHIRIVGGLAIKRDEQYYNYIKNLVKIWNLDRKVTFVGPRTHDTIVAEYRLADIFINLSNTGSLDKAVLEAMACGVPVITSNEAFRDLLQPIDRDLYVERDSKALALAIARIITMSPEARRELGLKLRNVVVRDHDLKQLIARILSLI
jgi:glycosyltransferase involved in cell wall biosynthesis